MQVPLVIVIPSTAAITLIAVLLALKYIDKIQIAWSMLLQLILTLRAGGARVQRAFIASHIQGRINEFSAYFGRAGLREVIPYKLRIEWAKVENREQFFRKGELVVRMKYHEDQDTNFVAAMMIYLKRCLLLRAKRYIDDRLARGSELYVGKRILSDYRMDTALDHFYRIHLDPEIKANPELSERIRELEALDLRGWLNRILFKEFLGLARRLYPAALVPDDVRRETLDFVEFLEKIVTKARDEDVDLWFNRFYIKVGVILIAKAEKIEFGATPYLGWIRTYCERNADSVYLCAWGPRNVAAAKAIAKVVENDEGLKGRLVKDFDDTYSAIGRDAGDLVKSVCIAFANKTPRPIMKLG
ncbi:MAG: hypothetical protein U1B94_01030 [candidate division NC10 bacterium]|nr:hypothetical protein [candidate division NC10 bacterium]